MLNKTDTFRRPHWDKNLHFKWDSRVNSYRYIDGAKWGYRVGQGVLESNDFINTTNKKETKMLKNVNYIGTGYQVVEVKYKGSEVPYTFKTNISLLEGEIVVVEDSKGYSICIVLKDSMHFNTKAETVKAFNRAKAWVVSKIDTIEHDKRKEATERKECIINMLEERKDAMQETAIYELLAQSDPEAKKLLAELKEL